MTSEHFADIAGLVLAGGEGRRLGGLDKGLVVWQGRPLVSQVADVLAALVDPVIVSANRSLSDYRTIAGRVVEDEPRYRMQGPLAGLLAGLTLARAEGKKAVLVCPCDTPDVEPAMLACLCRTWQAQPARAVVALSGDRVHPLHGVFPVTMVAQLALWLDRGERRVQGFAREVDAYPLDCDRWPQSFVNRNRPEDFAQG